MCKFNRAWIGICKEEPDKDYCEVHAKTKCSVCGGQAEFECYETAQFVCGTPLCSDVRCKLSHYITHHPYADMFIKCIEEEVERQGYSAVEVKKETYRKRIANLKEIKNDAVGKGWDYSMIDDFIKESEVKLRGLEED